MKLQVNVRIGLQAKPNASFRKKKPNCPNPSYQAAGAAGWPARSDPREGISIMSGPASHDIGSTGGRERGTQSSASH